MEVEIARIREKTQNIKAFELLTCPPIVVQHFRLVMRLVGEFP